MKDTWITQLDVWLPTRGECGVCGQVDARHRVTDAVRERILAGEPEKDVAADYGLPPVVVRILGMLTEDEYQGWINGTIRLGENREG